MIPIDPASSPAPALRDPADAPGADAADPADSAADSAVDSAVRPAPVACVSGLRAAFLGLGSRFSMPVRVVRISAPELDDERAYVILTVQDPRNRQQYESLPVYDYAIVEQANAALESGELQELIACFHGDPDARRVRARLDIEALGPLPRPSSLLGAPPEVVEKADAFIDQYADQRGLLYERLRDIVHQHMGIVTAGRSRRFRQCDKAVMLQALSHGAVLPIVNSKLSMVISSRPGTSKKILALCALVLAPIGQFVQPTMVSAAGLSARVEQTPSGWRGVPGALPNCHGGVVVIEDFHRLPQRQIKLLQGCLAAVAEDGKVVPTKAATGSYAAETAIHINTNMNSLINATLRAPGARGKMKDLGLPFDLLSRIDMILHLDAGDNAAAQAREIATQDVRPPEPGHRRAQRERELFVKAVVARLKDRFGYIDFKPVVGQIGQLMDDISLIIGDYSARMTEEEQQVFDGDGLLRRIANSLRKLIAASARLDGRGYATAEDLQTAWDMLAFKLEVVRWICDDKAVRVQTIQSREEAVAKARQGSEARFGQIMAQYAGQEVYIAAVAKALGLSARTVGRELEGRGVYPVNGLVTLPTPGEWAEMQARLARGERLLDPDRVVTDEDFEAPEVADAEAQPVPTDRPVDAQLQPLPAEYEPILNTLDSRRNADLDQRDVMRALMQATVEYDARPHRTDELLSDVKGMIEHWMGQYAPYAWLKTLDEAFEVLRGPDEAARTELALRIMLDVRGELSCIAAWYFEDHLDPAKHPPRVHALVVEMHRILQWRDERKRRLRKLEAEQAEEERKQQARRGIYPDAPEGTEEYLARMRYPASLIGR